MSVFYISDTHFSHDNILKFEKEKRPFETIEEHDEYLINAWNETVSENDTIIHLGDVCFKPATRLDPVMKQLNGNKILLLGNHDTLRADRYLRWFDQVHSVIADKQRGILFSHYPVHTSQLDYRYRFNVHGHSHSKQIDDPRYINICCEHTELRPINEAQLNTRIHKALEQGEK